MQRCARRGFCCPLLHRFVSVVGDTSLNPPQSLANIKGEVMSALVAKLESDDEQGPLGRLRTWADDKFARKYVEDHIQKVAEVRFAG